jgi:hypothetical protein
MAAPMATQKMGRTSQAAVGAGALHVMIGEELVTSEAALGAGSASLAAVRSEVLVANSRQVRRPQWQ